MKSIATPDMNLLWDGYIPSTWTPPRPFSRRGAWDWWRAGVIEGRMYGPCCTGASLAREIHNDDYAAAYNAGVAHAGHIMAAQERSSR